VTSPAKGFRTIADFVAAARAKPGSFNYTSTGTGTATHLTAERFRASAGIAAVHIPVKSRPEALTEVMSGRAESYFCPIGRGHRPSLLEPIAQSPTPARFTPTMPATAEAQMSAPAKRVQKPKKDERQTSLF
jgi:hypothetical protein